MRRAAAWFLLAVYVALAGAAVWLAAFDGADVDAVGALGFAAFAGAGTADRAAAAGQRGGMAVARNGDLLRRG